MSLKKINRNRRRHALQNEQGIAALILVVLGIVVVATFALQFFADTQVKQQGASVGYTSNNAYVIAESGMRYAEKCLTTNSTDANCPCNSGLPNDCQDYANLVDFTPIPFGDGDGEFEIDFTNKTACFVDVTSIGRFKGAERQIKKNVGNELIATIEALNPQGTNIASNGVLGTNNPQHASDPSNKATTTLAYTVSAVSGSDLILVVAAGGENATGANAIPSGATYAGVAMTAVNAGSSTNVTGDDSGFRMFWKTVTPGQTGNIIVTFPAKSKKKTIHAITMVNVDATGPDNSGTYTSGANETTFTTPVTTTSGTGIAITGTHFNHAVAITASGTGHTQIGATEQSSQSAGAMASVNASTTAANVGYTSPSTAGGFAMSWATFKPATGTISFSYTVPTTSSTNVQLVVVSGAEVNTGTTSETLASSASFGANAMTNVGFNSVLNGSIAVGVTMFRLSVSSGDTGVISVVYPSSTLNRTVHAITLTETQNVNPTPVETNQGTGGVTTLTDDITTTTKGAMIVSGAYQDEGEPMAVTGTGHTQRDEQPTGNSGTAFVGAMGTLLTTNAGLVSGTGWDMTGPPSTNAAVMILAAFQAISLC